jgi:flagellar hook-basal body complex protein FliE
MKIGAINNILPELQIKEIGKTEKGNFDNILTDFIGSVNKMQNDSAEITKDFINGENVELHEVMIAGEKAKTSLELLMEIRNKTVDMYRELTRMQP